MPITEPIDEDELQADLDKLEQEELDEKMLRTGTVPVADSLSNRLPAGPTGASTSLLFLPPPLFFLFLSYFCSPPIIFPISSLLIISSTLTKAGVCVAFFYQQSKANPKLQKKTKKPNWQNSRQKWPCEISILSFCFFFSEWHFFLCSGGLGAGDRRIYLLDNTNHYSPF